MKECNCAKFIYIVKFEKKNNVTCRMERNRPKCVTARGPLARSDSRKTNRRSESPENVSIKTKDKHTPKRHR